LTQNWCILGGYRTFPTHPTDMIGVGLTTLALYKPQSMPLIAVDLSPQLMVWWTPKGLRHLGRFGSIWGGFLSKNGHFWPKLGSRGLVFSRKWPFSAFFHAPTKHSKISTNHNAEMFKRIFVFFFTPSVLCPRVSPFCQMEEQQFLSMEVS
jgi:hypothetical protein